MKNNHDGNDLKNDHDDHDSKSDSPPLVQVELTKTTHNTFVQLLLMKRILFAQTHVINDDPNNPYTESAESIAKDIQDLLVDIHLPKQTPTDHDNNHVTCTHILTQIRNNSISKYMKDCYNDSQCVLINIIFNQIILKHYIQ